METTQPVVDDNGLHADTDATSLASSESTARPIDGQVMDPKRPDDIPSQMSQLTFRTSQDQISTAPDEKAHLQAIADENTNMSSPKSPPNEQPPSPSLQPKTIAAPPSEIDDQIHSPSLTFHRTHQNHWEATHQTTLRNNLMLIVGFLELTNALDFPANVWNQTPVPLFAVGLMATGGSIAILSSCWAFIDLRKSLRNYKLLRQEHHWLRGQRKRLEPGIDDAKLSMLQAYLELNFREMCWELVDRIGMDSLNGSAGILVGAGTLLAIGGANPNVFHASNLLSGYIGNSFNVVYGFFNTIWSGVMWYRSRRAKRAVNRFVSSVALKARMRRHIVKHTMYAYLQGVFVAIAAVGSMVSATMWQGYVVLIPCVIVTLVTNVMWRYGSGYDRVLCMQKGDVLHMDVERRLRFVNQAQDMMRRNGSEGLIEGLSKEQALDFVVENDLFEDFCAVALRRHGLQRYLSPSSSASMILTLSRKSFSDVPEKEVVSCVQQVLDKHGLRRFRDQERWLAELWSNWLAQGLKETRDIRVKQEKG